MSVGTASPSVFDAGLPTLDSDVTATPQQVYPQLLAAQRLAPIALGPLGPKVLSYELVRTVLAQSAVNETMRHSPISNSLLRTVTEDVELAGVVFPAGTMVMANTAAANRDPAIYDDPDRFDITREGLPTILTFGAGVHFCLGANLARLEIAEALTAVTRRIPTPRRNGPAPWKPMIGLSGPTSLPIAFDT